MAEQFLKNTSVFLLHTEMTADGGVTGMINRISHGEAVSFAGLDQALLMINEWLDEEKPLSSDSVLRTFETGRRRRPAAHAVSGSVSMESGHEPFTVTDAAKQAGSDAARLAGLGRRGDARRKEAFLVRIICRQHNSWQGEVCWKAQRLYFRSTLELMCLIHSALDPGAVKSKSAARSIARPVFRVV